MSSVSTSWAKVAIDEWAGAASLTGGNIIRPLNKGGKLTGDHVTPQLVYRVVNEYASELGYYDLAAHDLRWIFTKLAHKGRTGVDRIQLTLGHESLKTTESYLGVEQNLTDAPCDRLGLDLSGDWPPSKHNIMTGFLPPILFFWQVTVPFHIKWIA